MFQRALLSTLRAQRPAASAAVGRRFFSAERRHVIAALVVNQPGCLAEIANLFAARGAFVGGLVAVTEELDDERTGLQATTSTASWSAARRWRSSRA